MRLALFEYLSGGGFTGELPAEMLSEGYSMLYSLTEDFREEGHLTTTLLDPRLPSSLQSHLPADRILSVGEGGVEESLQSLFEAAEACLIIAPESGGTLTRLTRLLEESGIHSLNSGSDAVEACSDKAALQRVLKKQGLRVPETRYCRTAEGVDAALEAADALGYPVVFKPAVGAGCTGASLVTEEGQVPLAFHNLSREEGYVAQKFVEGIPVSVSLLCTPHRAEPLTLNLQRVELRGPEGESRYLGGLVPFDHPRREEAFEAARRSVGGLPGLRGYVGVDLILDEGGPVVLEVNPRITVSYIGLRRVVKASLAKLIIDSVEGRLPQGVLVEGYTYFSKINFRSHQGYPRLQASVRKYVVCPPLRGVDSYCTLLAVRGETSSEAERLFHEAEGRLLGGGG